MDVDFEIGRVRGSSNNIARRRKAAAARDAARLRLQSTTHDQTRDPDQRTDREDSRTARRRARASEGESGAQGCGRTRARTSESRCCGGGSRQATEKKAPPPRRRRIEPRRKPLRRLIAYSVTTFRSAADR